MERKTNNSKKVAKYANQALRVSRNALLIELYRGMYEAYRNNGNRLPYGHLAKLLKEVQPGNEWLSRNMLNKAFIKYRSKQVLTDVAVVDKEHPKTISITIVCKPLKRKSDGKMPYKKEDLLLKYKEWHGRPAPVFDVDDINVGNDELLNNNEIDNVDFVTEDILCEV